MHDCRTRRRPNRVRRHATKLVGHNEGIEKMTYSPKAIIEAFGEPDLADALEALFFVGVTVLPMDDYYELIDFERAAVRRGYPKLQ